jgi:hypothetical protein
MAIFPDRPSQQSTDVCAILKQCVEKHPELRVGQIIVAATKTIDVFHMPDEELARKLNEYLWCYRETRE